MTDIEFVLSLTPEQVYKFTEFNYERDFTVGIISDMLYVHDKTNGSDYRMNYKWINNKWEEHAHI